jgi:hypothetical protein
MMFICCFIILIRCTELIPVSSPVSCEMDFFFCFFPHIVALSLSNRTGTRTPARNDTFCWKLTHFPKYDYKLKSNYWIPRDLNSSYRPCLYIWPLGCPWEKYGEKLWGSGCNYFDERRRKGERHCNSGSELPMSFNGLYNSGRTIAQAVNRRLRSQVRSFGIYGG